MTHQEEVQKTFAEMFTKFIGARSDKEVPILGDMELVGGGTSIAFAKQLTAEHGVFALFDAGWFNDDENYYRRIPTNHVIHVWNTRSQTAEIGEVWGAEFVDGRWELGNRWSKPKRPKDDDSVLMDTEHGPRWRGRFAYSTYEP